MAADNVAELIVKLTGDKEVLRSLESIQDAKDKLTKQKIQAEYDRNSWREMAHDIKAIMDDLKKELSKELISKESYDNQTQYWSQMKNDATNMANTYSDTIAQINNAMHGLTDAENEIIAKEEEKARTAEEAAQKQAEAAEEAARRQKEADEEAAKSAEEQARREQEAAEATARAEEEAAARAAEAEAAHQRQIEETIASYQRLGDAVSTVGQVMTSIGGGLNSMVNLTDNLAGAFGQMQGMFSSNVFDTIEKTLIVLATKAFTADMGKVTGRYDIMNTFTDYMELTGVSAERANEALQKVNQSILGLPIGLDESAQRLRRYQMFMDDIDAATNLTIGLQKAVVAGGANAQMKNQAYLQVDRLLSAGKLNTARQWLSLIQGLGVSMRFVSEAMGVTGMTTKELAAGLAGGSIDAQQFLNALQELGKGGTSAAEGLEKALEIYKGTIESWLSNIQFATTRGGETILKSLNTMLLDVSGQGIVDYMRRYRDFLNDMYKGIGNFITGNPVLFTQGIDRIESLIESLGRFNATQIATEGFENILKVGNIIQQVIDSLPTEDTGKFIAFATTLAGPVSKAITTMTSGLPILLGVFERFKDFDFETVFERVLEQVDNLANIVAGVLNLIPDGVMGELMAFAMVWGKPLAGAFTAVGGALEGLGAIIPKLAPGLAASEAGVVGSILKLVVAEPGILAAAAAVSALAVAVASYGTARKMQDKAISEEFGISEMGAMTAQAEKMIEGFTAKEGEFRSKFRDIVIGASDAKAAIKELAANDTFLRNADPRADTSSAQANQKRLIEELTKQYPFFSNAIDQNTGLLNENGLALVQNGESVVAMIQKQAEAEAYLERATELASERLELQAQDDLIQKRIEESDGRIKEWEAELDKIAQNAFNPDEKRRTELYGAIDLEKEGIKELEAEHDRLGAKLEDNAAKTQSYKEAAEEAANVSERLSQTTAGEVVQMAELRNEITGATVDFSEYVDELGDAYEDISKSVASIVGAFGEVEAADTVGLDSMTANLEKQVEILENVKNNINDIQEFTAQYGDTLGAGFKAAVDTMVTDPNSYAGEIQGLKNAIDTAVQTGDFKGIIKFSDLFEEKSELIGETSAEALATKALTEIGNAVTAVAEENPALFGDALNGLFTNAFQVNDETREAIDKSLEETQKMMEEKMQELGSTVTTLSQALAGEGGEASSGTGMDTSTLASSIQTAQNYISSFVDESVPMFMEAMGELADQITTFTDETVENLRAKIEETDKAMEELEKEITTLTTLMSNKSGMIDDFAGHFDTLKEKVDAATEAVQALQSAINSLESKNIDVGANVGGEVVHRASGGFVPHGTDTVPAMLTPGEFVVRRSAAQKIGAPVLNMLNMMDIPHAVDALMSRVARPLTHSFINYDNRRTYDNHATVNQTIYTDNPSFTYRRASRFAHAL